LKTIVIYKSKTGFTQKYAKWIAEDLNCESLPAAKAVRHDLSAYDVIIYGGPVMAGGIMGWKKFRGRLGKFPKAQPVLFACGLAPENDEEYMKNLKNQNLIAALLFPRRN
jgi:menaquinone-dependent protoporphyrinogen IX oxidase